MKKIWKAAVILAGLAVCVVLYLRSGRTESGQESNVTVTSGTSVPDSAGKGTAAAAETGSTATAAGESAEVPAFTETQREELKELMKEAASEAFGETVESSVRKALEDCLDQMIEDGRLESAIVQYASVQSGLVNVNTAGPEELEKLTGIGSAKAQAIAAYREEHGPFSSLEELTNVSGISAGILEKFRDQATL